MTLHEETLVDHKFSRIMNANFGEYHVPVNVDVHDIEVTLSTSAAIANAVYHATGKRIRDLAITLHKLRRQSQAQRNIFEKIFVVRTKTGRHRLQQVTISSSAKAINPGWFCA
jgi:CO/xanthine dehydrogenase Mo-binding subunit